MSGNDLASLKARAAQTTVTVMLALDDTEELDACPISYPDTRFVPDHAEVTWAWDAGMGWLLSIYLSGPKVLATGRTGTRRANRTQTPSSREWHMLPESYQRLAESVKPTGYALPAELAAPAA